MLKPRHTKRADLIKSWRCYDKVRNCGGLLTGLEVAQAALSLLSGLSASVAKGVCVCGGGGSVWAS